jgi:DNA polymerase-1
MQDFREAIRTCEACPLFEQKGRAVPGIGPTPAKVMLVGEGPGFEEAQTGRPFVGASGRKLDVLFSLLPWPREDCYVTNVVKHRTLVNGVPKNRPPKVSEIKACRTFLEREFEAVQPEIIITLGGTSGPAFDPSLRNKLKQQHGRPRRIEYCGRDVILYPTFHPAYALRDPNVWALLAQDFHLMEERLAQAGLPAKDVDYQLITDEQAALWVSGYSEFGFDLETTSPMRGGRFAVQEADIVGYSISTQSNRGAYTEGRPSLLGWHLSSSVQTKVCHNLKFEVGRLRKTGITLRGFEDTKLAAYLLQLPSSHLKDLTRDLLGREPISYAQATEGRDMSELDPSEIVDYAAADADNTLQIWQRLKPKLIEEGLWKLYKDVELPLVPIIDAMEGLGVKVDEAATTKLLLELDAALGEEGRKVYAAGLPETYSISSRQQLASGLFELSAPIKTRTTDGYLKTDKATLEAVRWWRPELIDGIRDYRAIRGLRARVSKYLSLRDPGNGRLHPSINQCGHIEEVSDSATESPRTGRLSMSNPNMQNNPHHGEKVLHWAPRLRKCFVPSDGMLFVAADVSQQEPRIVSVVAPEPQMAADFTEDIPIYGPIGEAIYGRLINKHEDEREWHVAKTFFLSLLYGAGWQKLMEIEYTFTPAQARRGHARVVGRYPGLVGFGERVKAELHEKGYAQDYFGRRRYLPGVFTNDARLVAAAEREAINMHVQGPAATLIKMAMLRVDDFIRREGLAARLLLQVHDELVLEVPPQELPILAPVLQTMCDGIMPINFPVEVNVGKNWGEMKPYEGGTNGA